MSEPIKIFIGTSANGEDAEAEMTYEYTLRKNTAAELDITWMKQTHDTSSLWGEWNTSQWSTPFSGFRWAIPEACGFKGRAIYTDCDMLNLKDISELINVDMEDKPIVARSGNRFGGKEFCVTVFDCELFEELSLPVNRMKVVPEAHHRLIAKFSKSQSLVGHLDARWNCLDGENRPIEDMWQLHFTNMGSQPWNPAWFTGAKEYHKRPELIHLWNESKLDAIDAGYKVSDYIPEEPFGAYNIIGK
tara:strand:+ start:8958 stop:9695 length:738 start_codon:yes stop_codon:yes gene_type:complete